MTISTPATAGPTTRALFITTPLRLTALARSPGGTSEADERLPGRGVDDLHEAADHVDRDDEADGRVPGSAAIHSAAASSPKMPG